MVGCAGEQVSNNACLITLTIIEAVFQRLETPNKGLASASLACSLMAYCRRQNYFCHVTQPSFCEVALPSVRLSLASVTLGLTVRVPSFQPLSSSYTVYHS